MVHSSDAAKWQLPGWRIEQSYSRKCLIGNWEEDRRGKVSTQGSMRNPSYINKYNVSAGRRACGSKRMCALCMLLEIVDTDINFTMAMCKFCTFDRVGKVKIVDVNPLVNRCSSFQYVQKQKITQAAYRVEGPIRPKDLKFLQIS